MELKYFSTFSGIGGFELGIDNKAKCIGFSEINKYATQIYKKHFPGHKNYGDITTINASELPDFDLLVGGFPCQSFSIAGKRKGFKDTRGTLFFDLARILQAKQPELFIFENVKGLLSHDNGQTFKTIIATLVELGYCVEWQVLNSKNHGVPQNRERVFIVGHFGGKGRRQVFPIGKGSKQTIQLCEQPVANCIKARLDADGGGSYFIEGKLNEEEKRDIVSSVKANHFTQNVRNIHNDGYAFTISQDQNDSCVAKGYKVRRLTPTECERLQGFPDGWTEGISDSQRYKCLGNAVTVNVVSEIIKNILYE